ncbi:MAG TPA: cysteine desulfurase family protein [Anaerolineales bacterium]
MPETMYLDYAATTPTDPRVVEAMTPYFSETFGNPSSVHHYGQSAERALEAARETVARILNSSPEEIVFTSCGTESDNLAIRGAALAARANKGTRVIVTSRTEHHAVSKTAEQLAALHGFEVRWLQAEPDGTVVPARVGDVIGDDCALASVMYANNEIGTINPIAEIAAVCRAKGVTLHSDAVQAAAYLPLDVNALGIDIMSLGAHKFHGPKGVGALYVRRGTHLTPAQTGGSQESGLRAGTQNVPLIVGFARALELAQEERTRRASHATTLRDHIIGFVLEQIPESRLTGSPDRRLPNHASFVFKDVDGNLLLTLLDASGFACSSGSACKTGNPEPSEVLTSIGLAREWSLGSLRVTVGKDTTASDVEAFLAVLPGTVQKARSLRSGAG